MIPHDTPATAIPQPDFSPRLMRPKAMLERMMPSTAGNAAMNQTHGIKSRFKPPTPQIMPDVAVPLGSASAARLWRRRHSCRPVLRCEKDLVETSKLRRSGGLDGSVRVLQR